MPKIPPSETPLPYRLWMLVALVSMTLLAARGILGGPMFGTPASDGEERFELGLIEELMSDFGYETSDVLLLVEGDDLFRPDAVAATRELVQAFEAMPGVLDVLSLDDVPREARLFGGTDLLPEEGSPAEEFAAARATALAHPLVRGYLSDAQGQVWVLPISLDYNWLYEDVAVKGLYEDVAVRNEQLKQRIHGAVDYADMPADMRVSLTGAWMLAEASENRFEYEQWLYHSIAYVLTFLLAAAMFRGVTAVILSGAGPLLGVIWAFGLSRLFGVHLSSLTLILLPVMLMMIGFTDSVHLMMHIRKERTRGLLPPAATASALRILALPCILTSVTTGLGFASLLTARSELVRDFGAACALGVLCTLIAVLTFLPLFASSRLGMFLRERESSRLVSRSLPISDRVQAWTARHAGKITALGCILTAAAIWHGSAIETESRIRADVPESSSAARALRVIDGAFGGSNSVQITVLWDAEHDGDWPAILDSVEQAVGVVAPETEHSRPLSVIDVLDFLAPSGERAAAMSMLSLLPKRLTAQVIDNEARLARIELYLPDRGYRHFKPTFAVWQTRLDEVAQQHPGFEFDLGGQAVWTGQSYEIFTRDLMESLALAAVIMFVVLTATFRSLRLGLISIIPNAIPLAATASLLVAFDIPMAGATAFVMSLGIAVDDTIHFLTRYRHEYAIDHDVDKAIRRSVHGVGKALVMTTVVLVIGFASVMTSDFPRNRVFSGMICVTLLAALVSDLVLLPAMLRTFAPRHKPATRQ